MSPRELESALEARLVQSIKKRGGIALKLMPTVAGIPDRLVIMPPRDDGYGPHGSVDGRLILVELKADGGKLSPIQVVMHERLAARGVHVIVLYGRVQIDAWVGEL